ncbi:LAFE_0A01288g1_1 [Lachancea fermentati]|uniref:allantoicase n=1 Tax=Lachancea fermentati TaxID=4955 RepID=A0A1G4M6F7_LACFM|nr:LAFE_0A01288g1_1 [Lachancea fermentati]
MALTLFSHEDADAFLSAVTARHLAVDVVGKKLGGKVLACSDEWFAAAANLVEPRAPVRDATRFTHAGAWYDGWETRRHNTAAYDWVILRMGVAAAHIVGCEVDTAFFNGNHAPEIAVQALYDEDADDVSEDDARWTDVIGRTACGPSQRQFMLRDAMTDAKYTHVKLQMFPDGGIARFRLYGHVVPPAALLRGAGAGAARAPLDLASVCHGGVALCVSDQHFGSADNLLLPGRGHDMSDGWETSRSREPGHVDWVVVQLGGRASHVARVVVDTAHFRGNFPQYITVHGLDAGADAGTGAGAAAAAVAADDARWFELVPKSKTGPDHEHVYDVARDAHVTHVKLTIIPDGGVKRVRVYGW